MVTVTSIKSGIWGTDEIWDTGHFPGDGDNVVISAGHTVMFNDAQSGMAVGISGMVINGVLHFKSRGKNYLKMGGNITGTGMLIVAEVMNVPTSHYYGDENEPLIEFITHPEYPHIYGTGFVWEGVSEFDAYGHVEYERQRIAHISEDGDLIEGYTEVDTIEELAITPESFMRMMDDYGFEGLYIHTSTGASPMDFEDFTYIREIGKSDYIVDSLVTIMFNATGTINIPTIRMYGWYPEREYTQLDADAELNATTIVLKEDLDLQEGDLVLISSGTERGRMVESNKGVYTIQSYNAETKTITLTSGLQTARLEEDYVACCSRPIKISRTSGNAALVKTNISGVVQGVNSGGFYIIRPDIGVPENIIRDWTFNHFTSNFYPIVWGDDLTITNGLIYGSSAGLSTISDAIINNIIFSGMSYPLLNMAAPIEGCIIQNVAVGVGSKGCPVLVKNCVMKNIVHITDSDDTIFKSCDFSGRDEIEVNCLYHAQFIDCIFREPVESVGWLGNIWGTLDNCLFEGTENINYQAVDKPKYIRLESFNHNQITGNYKAWMRGGRIITENNKLKYICESADAPVFRDYPIIAPGNRTIKRLIGLTKDTPGIVSKLQIIDPANDPLIDSTATPLAEATAQDTIDNQQIGVAYKSGTPRQLILRILCQNSSGEVLVDTTRIDQSLAKRIK